jgi:hypothetical protein
VSKNKITLRDIANECNVSVATVSYVLNHSEKEKIAHTTRLKIVEAATRLHYVPNAKAKCHVNKKSNLIGIIVNLKRENTSSKKIIYYDLVAELSYIMQKMGFETVLIPTNDLSGDVNVIAKHSLDAVFIIDADNRFVKKITQHYYVPIIFIDCVVNDPLFCSIYPDYTEIIEKSKEILNTSTPFLIMEDICNQELKEQISNQFLTKDIFVNAPGSNIRSFLQMHRYDKGIVFGDILGLEMEKIFDGSKLVVMSNLGDKKLFHPSTPLIYVKNESKASIAASIFKEMQSLNYESNEQNKVLVKCEYI